MASDLAYERFVAAFEGARDYSQGAIFLGAEEPWAGEALLRNIREGRPAVVVYPDGLERVIEPRPPAQTVQT